MSLANIFQGFAAGKASDLPAFGSSWRNYDFSGGTTPVDYIAQGPQAASTSALGGLSGMWPMAIAGLGSSLIQGVFGSSAADKSAAAARYAAKQGRKTAKEQLKEQRRQFGASLGYQTAEADRDLARQFGALRFGSQFMAESPAFARNFRREQMANLALQGASPQYMALAGRFMA